jgi:hypothetical protein
VKAGLLVERYRDFMTNPTFSLGIYTFANVRAFLTNTPLRFVGLGPVGDFNRNWPWTLYGAYVQDSISVGSRVTVNGGLRYEYSTMPVDTGGRDSALVSLSDAAPRTGRLYEGPPKGNLSPRVGGAWDIFGDGSTSLRAGYGLYFNSSNQQNLIVTVTNPPATPRFVIANPTFPTPPFERGVGNTIRPMSWDLEFPRLHVWNASVQRVLPAGLVGTIAYAGARGKNLFRNTDANIPTPVPGPDGRLFFAAGLPRPNRSFGTIELKSSDGESWYRALILELRRAWRNGLSVQSSYTWSRSRDTTQASTFFSDSTNGTTVAFPEFDPDYNLGPSDWDTPHTWVSNAVWDIPTPTGGGAARALLGGWQVTGIATLRSGQPLTVFVQNNWSRSQWSPSISPTSGLDRPDLAPGRTGDDAVRGDPLQWFDPAAFVLQPQGTLGNSGRGAFRGPDLRTVDLSAVKRIALAGTDTRLDIRLEVFNVFNRANFANPTLIAFAGTAAGEAPLPTFGRIRSTVTSARQMQIGIRLVF